MFITSFFFNTKRNVETLTRLNLGGWYKVACFLETGVSLSCGGLFSETDLKDHNLVLSLGCRKRKLMT